MNLETLALNPTLCRTCRNVREVVSGKGSRFWLCQLSTIDRDYPKYPAQPVIRCRGYKATPANEEG